MKVKTRKIIAAITATALIGAAVGVSAFALNNSTDNDFGFKGTYSLDAFADTATETTKTVVGKTVDVTNTLTIQSTDDAHTYTLFISVVDTSDMTGLENIYVGYAIGENLYNGTEKTLTQTVYSSLTIHTSETETETIEAASYKMKNATNNETDAVPVFVIAEVETETVGSNTPNLYINCAVSKGDSMSYTSNSSVTYSLGQNIDYLNYTANTTTFTTKNEDGSTTTATVTKHSVKDNTSNYSFTGVILTFITAEDNLEIVFTYTADQDRYFYVSGNETMQQDKKASVKVTLGKAGVYTITYDGNEHKPTSITWN